MGYRHAFNRAGTLRAPELTCRVTHLGVTPPSAARRSFKLGPGFIFQSAALARFSLAACFAALDFPTHSVAVLFQAHFLLQYARSLRRVLAKNAFPHLLHRQNRG